ncbi:MAG: phosphorylase, partial [Proteobacteria bacterium]|nr:phosphorylase [Pseudomonadota bacterium]
MSIHLTDYPILEYDPAPEALIEPSRVLRPVAGMPERCVLPMYDSVVRDLLDRGLLMHVTDMGSSMGALPVYRLEHRGIQVAVAHPGLGAPLAAAVMEELIAFGCRTFIACGDAGVVDGGWPKGAVVVPSRAVRDEGTSYHYAPPAREIDADPAVVAVIEDVLREEGAAYR